MSLALQVDTVVGVLLSDGWHRVTDQSFYVDSYEYLEGSYVMHGGGQSDVCATGFGFREQGDLIAGPLTAIFAVKVERTRERA